MEKIRVCVWATTFQANIYSLTKYLISKNLFDIVVVTEESAKYSDEPLAKIRPLKCLFLDKNDSKTLKFIKNEFKPDVTIVDNHYPPEKISQVLVNVWHGFGWKGPEDKKQFASVFREIKKLTGISPDKPNNFFKFISAGNTNYEYRINITGFAPENVAPLGQAFTDDIIKNDIKRSEIIGFYPKEFENKKICLFAPTWHFGRIFSHLGDDIEILERIFKKLETLGAALILRMHDKKRFEPEYLEKLEELAANNPLVLLKYKDTDRDNLLDILVSDIMMSNYSSILTFFYGTGRPTIHIHPVDKKSEISYYRVWKNGAVRTEKAPEKSYIWSLPPEENGGLVAETVEEIEASLKKALNEPLCCKAKSEGFIQKHTAPYDGHTCERIAGIIEEIVLKNKSNKKKRFIWF